MKKVLLFFFLATFLAFIAGCAPSGTTTPPTPNQTQAPQLLIVRAGGRNLQSGDSIQGSATVTFEGRGASNAIIRVYLNGKLSDTTTTDATGIFTYTWTSGTTEGSFNFGFSAETGGLSESTQTPFQIVVDLTPPYLLSCFAKADSILGDAPIITVKFNEPVTIGDKNLFETTLFWNVGCPICPGGSTFTVTKVTLEADNQTVTLTGNWMSDFLVSGDQITVAFSYHPLINIQDAAGNQFNAVAIVNFVSCTITP